MPVSFKWQCRIDQGEQMGRSMPICDNYTPAEQHSSSTTKMTILNGTVGVLAANSIDSSSKRSFAQFTSLNYTQLKPMKYHRWHCKVAAQFTIPKVIVPGASAQHSTAHHTVFRSSGMWNGLQAEMQTNGAKFPKSFTTSANIHITHGIQLLMETRWAFSINMQWCQMHVPAFAPRLIYSRFWHDINTTKRTRNKKNNFTHTHNHNRTHSFAQRKREAAAEQKLFLSDCANVENEMMQTTDDQFTFFLNEIHPKLIR